MIVVIAAGHALNSLTFALFAAGLMHFKPKPPALRNQRKNPQKRKGHVGNVWRTDHLYFGKEYSVMCACNVCIACVRTRK